MYIRIKICGVTSREAARAAVCAGVDAIGFVFSESPHQVTPAQAAAICKEEIPPWVQRFAVFRHPLREQVEPVLAEFTPHYVQIEMEVGESFELPAGVRLMPVFRDGHDLLERMRPHLVNGRRYKPRLHLETSEDHGEQWSRASRVARSCRLTLAGGLHPENVQEAIVQVQPYCVDVSSGVESSPGVKDSQKIAEFVRAAWAGVQILVKRRRREMSG